MKDIIIPPGVAALISRIEASGHSAYIVGGCVRDALMGRVALDYDIATSATPDEVQGIFRDARVIPTGKKHGTVTVILGGTKAEITTFRKESGYSDYRHPDKVCFTDSPARDAARRDFTVNAMFYNPAKGLLDFYGGAQDIKNGVIRTVGQPEKRFAEDALRILRGIRFSARLGFKVEPSTAAAMEKLAPLIKTLAAERIFGELRQIIATGKDEVIKRFSFVFPHVFGYNGEITPVFQYMPKYRLAVFTAAYGGSIKGAAECGARLKPDGATLRAIKAAAEAYYGEGIASTAELARIYRRHGAELGDLVCEVCSARGKPMPTGYAEYAEKLKSGKAPLQLKELDVDAAAIGVKGKALGAVLEELYDYAHNSGVNIKAALEEKTQQILKERRIQ